MVLSILFNLLITELRQFKHSVDDRLCELESRFDYQNHRIHRIEQKLEEHDARFDKQDRAIAVLQGDVSVLKS